MPTTVNTEEIQSTLQGALEKGGLDLVFEKWEKDWRVRERKSEKIFVGRRFM